MTANRTGTFIYDFEAQRLDIKYSDGTRLGGLKGGDIIEVLTEYNKAKCAWEWVEVVITETSGMPYNWYAQINKENALSYHCGHLHMTPARVV